MLINNCEQGTDEWKDAKIARPSSSNFDKIVTPSKLQLSAQSIHYRDELEAEFIEGELTQIYETEEIRIGREREPDARFLHSAIIGCEIEQVGCVYLDETKTILCSPDGLIKKDGKYIKGAEYKCPKLSTQIRRVREGVLPKEYLLQVQGSMWVTGLNEWDFMSYHPKYQPLLLTIKRDEAIISKLSEAVLQFSADLERIKKEWKESQLDLEVA